MTPQAGLLSLHEDGQTFDDSQLLEGYLSKFVGILKDSLQADVSGVIICGAAEAVIVSDGFTRQENKRISFYSKQDIDDLGPTLRGWWTGNLLYSDLAGPAKGVIFAGRRDGHGFSVRQRDLFKALAEFATVTPDSPALKQTEEEKLLAEERDRIACELHDGLAQSIYSMALHIKISRRLLQTDVEAANAKLAKLEQLAAAQIEDIRSYMRALKDNRGISTDLPAIIRKHMRQFCALNNLEFDLKVSGRKALLSQDIANNLYYVICEGLANIAKHAQASTARVSLTYEEAEIVVEIEDDGRGFDISLLGERRRGMGLENIENRVQQIGGTITIQSHVAEGTRIVAIVPYEVAAEEKLS